ncbi:MAG: Na+/H+ antiporter NhaC [Candidatus Azotimanducaceae bacterium]
MSEYGLLSLLPPVLTIALALWTRNIIISLGLGVLSGSLIVTGFHPGNAVLDVIENRIFIVIAKPSNIQIIFTMMTIGGFIKLLEVSGGAAEFARATTKLITGPRSAQLAAWGSGMAIFFTDTGNALIIGPLFRPIFRRLRICREKLAYILDATASPVCILIPFIGWGAYIMGLIENSYADIGLKTDAFEVLLEVMPYQFYAILTLFTVFVVVLSGREFGAMAKAQTDFDETPEESIESEPVSEPCLGSSSEVRPRVSLFVVPIATLLGLIGCLLGYFALTSDLTSTHIRSTLTIAYLCASIATAMLLQRFKMKSFDESLTTFISGTEKMVYVVIILIFAWSLSSVINSLGTAQTISVLIGDGINPAFLPAIVFLLGAGISFATGSSWGTFAILLSLAIPVCHAIDASPILTIAAVLSGGLFGDHTSPISDTTVLASIGADCPHLNHVTTQFAYALVPGMVALLAFIAAGFGESPIVLIPAFGLVVLVVYAITRFAARPLNP